MIRIVGVQRSNDVQQEFVLLQNQGVMREQLKGKALISENACQGQPGGVYIFADSERIGPGQFILLRSGNGQPHWGQSKDGAYVYFTFAGSVEPLWTAGDLHLLATCHTYSERQGSAVLV